MTIMLASLALLATAPAQACAVDETKMMSLTMRGFDQDLGGGCVSWRAIHFVEKLQRT